LHPFLIAAKSATDIELERIQLIDPMQSGKKGSWSLFIGLISYLRMSFFAYHGLGTEGIREGWEFTAMCILTMIHVRPFSPAPSNGSD
jgi:hypothetical protein